MQRSLLHSGIPPNVLKRLESCGIFTIEDVLSYTQFDLLHLLGSASTEEADQLLQCVSCYAAPTAATALGMLQSRARCFLKTGLVGLDKLLLGGLMSASITEIAGPSGCGKTQFCCMMAVTATLSELHGGRGGSALYIDTEGAATAGRLITIAQNRYPHVLKTDLEIGETIKNIFIYRATTTANLMEILNALQVEIIENNIKLIIIDSITSLIRKEVEHKGLERSKLLLQQAALLKDIAEGFNVQVVVTNQIQTVFSSNSPADLLEDNENVLLEECSAGDVKVALGGTWCHCVNTRLVLQYCDDDVRQIIISKSPVSPNACFYFTIEASGLELIPDSTQINLHGANPNEQRLQARNLSCMQIFRH